MKPIDYFHCCNVLNFVCFYIEKSFIRGLASQSFLWLVMIPILNSYILINFIYHAEIEK